MRKKLVVTIGIFLLGGYSAIMTEKNQVLKEKNDLLEVRDSLKTKLLSETRYESRVYRDFLQKSNYITKDCSKCREKILYEVSEDFDKFEILTKK